MQAASQYNNVLDITTDEAGNVYTLGRVGANNLQVDGHPVQAYAPVGIGARPDMLLSSFTKEGAYRWSKVIGGGVNNGIGLKSQNGLVYVSGFNVANDSAIFDTDTAYYHPYNGNIPKLAFLIQYDTAGVYQWLRMPATDTVPLSKRPEASYWIDIATNGDVYWLCDLRPGDLPNTNFTITNRGTYVLRYNTQGQLLGKTKLDIWHGERFGYGGVYNEGNFARNPVNGHFYLGGTYSSSIPLAIGSDTIEGAMYIAAFDGSGNLLWKKESLTKPNSGNLSTSNLNDFVLDNAGNILITGSTRSGDSLFNSIAVTSPNSYESSFVMKLDPSGNTLFFKNAVADPSFTYSISSSINDFAISGYHHGIYWQGPNDYDTLKAIPNQGYDAFIARFDIQSGDLLSMESATTPFGGACYGYSIAADNEGSYYLGGNFDQQLFLGPDTLYKIGSQRSFFVAKYACSQPEASFSISSDSLTGVYSFKYTGTESDSVFWDFGDGSGLVKGDSVEHTYLQKGSYMVCASSYAYCGDTTYCDTLEVMTVTLDEADGRINWSLAPNPASGKVRLYLDEHQAGGKSLSVEVFDLRGTWIAEYDLGRQVNAYGFNTSSWTPAVYVIILKANDKVVGYKRLIVGD